MTRRRVRVLALADIAPIVAKLMRLLASDKDGEVLAAARALCRVLDSAGLDIHDLVKALASADTANWVVVARHCWNQRENLSERERNFVRGILKLAAGISSDQDRWLRAIFERVQA
jgi:hypothetical protein